MIVSKSKVRKLFEARGDLPEIGESEPAVNMAAPLSSLALQIIAGGVVIALLYWARVVFITVISAVVVAFILEPFVAFLCRFRLPRPVSSIIVCSVAVAILYLLGLGAWNQFSSLASDAPAMRDRIANTVTSVSDRIQQFEEATAKLFVPRKPDAPPPSAQNNAKKSRKTISVPPPPLLVGPLPGVIPEVRIHEDRTPISDYIYSRLSALYLDLLLVSFMPLLVYFMLSWRDHLYRSFLNFFDGDARETAARSVQGVANMARAFVVGNFLIGVILAAMSCGLFATVRLPYPLLAGTLSGFLSLVPYVGIPLAMLPPVASVMATGAPTSVLLLSLAVALALHLIGMNVLYPTLVGGRVHLNPLVVTISLMFWAFLWDAAGLLLAIPIMAGLKAVCDNVEPLRKYGRFLGD
jgi:predicted PurR-regulated permease PerM